VQLFDDRSLARAALGRGVPAFLLVNPIEYHGPHLSLRNDHLVSVGVARDLHAELRRRVGLAGAPEEAYRLLLTRDLDVGVEPAPGPGSEPVDYFEVRRAVLDACRELAALGASRVVLVTFHGSPLHAYALEAGVRWLRRRGVRAISPMGELLWELLAAESPEGAAGSRYAEAYAHLPAERARALMADIASDFHGGFFETSLALHYAPESVRAFYTELPDCAPFAGPRLVARGVARLRGLGARARVRAEEVSLVARGAAWLSLRPFPGYTGAPSLATPAAGRVFARELTARFGDAAEAALHRGEAPRPPPLGWLRWATLFGRVGVHAGPGDMLRFDHLATEGGRARDGSAQFAGSST